MKSPGFPQTLNSAGRRSATLIKRLPHPGSLALRVRSAALRCKERKMMRMVEVEGRSGRTTNTNRIGRQNPMEKGCLPKALANPRDAPPAIGTPFPHLIGQHHPGLCSWGELETTAPNYCYHRHGSCGDYDCASVSHSAEQH